GFLNTGPVERGVAVARRPDPPDLPAHPSPRQRARLLRGSRDSALAPGGLRIRDADPAGPARALRPPGGKRGNVGIDRHRARLFRPGDGRWDAHGHRLRRHARPRRGPGGGAAAGAGRSAGGGDAGRDARNARLGRGADAPAGPDPIRRLNGPGGPLAALGRRPARRRGAGGAAGVRGAISGRGRLRDALPGARLLGFDPDDGRRRLGRHASRQAHPSIAV
ncbi:MAG: hypothetical protein AVDCRST_MAG12-1500, partial [uncultured Rubrobacteraceae bacterium]